MLICTLKKCALFINKNDSTCEMLVCMLKTPGVHVKSLHLPTSFLQLKTNGEQHLKTEQLQLSYTHRFFHPYNTSIHSALPRAFACSSKVSDRLMHNSESH
ncbi:hypothetical protein CDAR_251241 [Caerostris darwini]|uniref:Uncharacterized protein n=1 Tax=Caerostris darwini TaxID=1538125 RepID=A0AAV4R7X7_9ARAC|nr:hypothetical protein CDAR_251241 [Caerostris darwini]